MIKMTRQTDYAVRFLIALRTRGEDRPLSIKTFSEESTISFLFLQRIAQKLLKAGFVEARRGPSGGYTLVRDLDTVSLREIIETVEGTLSMTDCTALPDSCQSAKACHIKHGISAVEQQLLRILEETSLTALV